MHKNTLLIFHLLEDFPDNPCSKLIITISIENSPDYNFNSSNLLGLTLYWIRHGFNFDVILSKLFLQEIRDYPIVVGHYNSTSKIIVLLYCVSV